MPKQSTISQRKKPSQQRSKKTVRLIVETAKTVLAKEGISNFTISRIADRSGVTVGSIYQYFPNKEAIICEVYKEWLDKLEERYELFAERYKGLTNPVDYFSQCYLSTLDDMFSQYDGLAFELRIAFYANETLRQLDSDFDRHLIRRLTKDAIRLGAIDSSESLRVEFYYNMGGALIDVAAQADPEDREKFKEFATELIKHLARD